MTAVTERAPQAIRSIAPYQPGKPISELAREFGLAEHAIVKLASNENPLGMSPTVYPALEEAVAELARYPDGNGFTLKTAIAEKYRVQLNQIVLGNGSNDLLEIVAHALLSHESSAVFSRYAFAVYPLATQAAGAWGIEVPDCEYGHDLNAMLSAIEPSTKIVFIANPNNPTGTWIPPAEIEAFLNHVPEHVLVVLDEAYTEYLEESAQNHSIALLARFPNLMVVRTFSKAYGLAGLRVGFALAHPDVADLLNRVRQPFNVNSLALAAASAALKDTDFLGRAVALNRAGMAQIESALRELKLDYIPSFGNFMTFFHPEAASLNRYFLEQGVIVRPLAGYGLPTALRVSIGLARENLRFIEVLKAFQQANP